VEEIRSDWEILEAFTDAAVKYGLPRVTAFNRGDNFGIGYFDVNQNIGFRQNANHAFLPHKRANLHVMTETLVEKLLLDGAGGSATGCIASEWYGESEKKLMCQVRFAACDVLTCPTAVVV
jgi:choline dehydrogenase